MVYAVFTAEIESVHQEPNRFRLFSREVFIPVAFLFWNAGDLIGRMSVIVPSLSLAHRPWVLFVISVARLGFIPLYLLCNIGGRGAIVQSDFFYLFVVQLLFGVSNGYLGSSCMMGAGQWVSVDEREAAGGFMSMVLVGGLAAGSLMSFLVANI
jgi:equilibrative nucleoside transporter 1/2/3